MMRRDLLSNIQEWKIERTASVKGLRMEWTKYSSSVQIFGIQIKLLHLNSMEQKQRQCKHCFLSGVLLGIAANQNVRSLFSSVAQSCPTLCDPTNRSTPGLPVHHQLPEFTQTHVHRISDAIQPSHLLSSPFPPAPNPHPLQASESFPMSQLFA